MSKVFIVFFAALLLLAGVFALLSLSHEAAAQSYSQCQNATNDDSGDDTVINDGCPQLGARLDCDTDVVPDGDCTDPGEAALCTNAVDDDDSINDGCLQVGARKDCDTDVVPDGDCTDPGEAALCENNTSDDGADDVVVNDGCPQLGSRLDCDTDATPDGDCTDPGEPALCTNAVSDDPADDALGGYINDGCPKVGYYSEVLSVGGLAELPDVAGDSGSSAGTYAALAGGLAAAVLALGAGAWYARRRWGR
jgi:hypothetical protein